jgi:hypothetical protein
MTKEEFIKILHLHFGLCGCSDEAAMVEPIKRVLTWAATPAENKTNGETLFPESIGCFYIIAGILSDLDYIEHGSAIRYSWLTSTGEELLTFINTL